MSDDILFKKKLIDLKNKCKQLLKIFEIEQSSQQNSFQTNYELQLKHFDKAIDSSSQNRTLPIPFINKLLQQNIVDLKIKFISILGDCSYLKKIDEKIQQKLQVYDSDLKEAKSIIENFRKEIA